MSASQEDDRSSISSGCRHWRAATCWWRQSIRCVALVGLLLLQGATDAAERPVIKVWPDKAPGESKEIGPEGLRAPKANEKSSVQRLENVSVPTLTVFAPAAANGCAVIVAPGGGYSILAWDLEGTEVAEWLNSLGVTAFVLKYRVPKREGFSNNEPPLMDAQRAVSLVRSRAKEFAVDPQRIGMLGFSAGGNLTAKTCIGHAQRAYQTLDAVDEVSCRPDFGVLIYPAYLVDDAGQVRPEVKPNQQTPPMFFAHALNDPVKADNSVGLAMALKAVGVPTELHLYEAGGHGFGLRKSEFPCHTWPARCGDWLSHRGLLKRP